MASPPEDAATTSDPAPPIRSILKKTGSSGASLSDCDTQKVRTKSGRSISFGDKVTFHYEHADVEGKMAGGGDVKPNLVRSKAQGEQTVIEEEDCVCDVFEPDEEVRSKKSSFKGALKTKVGSLLRRSQVNRTQVQEGSPDHTPTSSISDLETVESGATSSHKKLVRLKKRSSDMFTASEIVTSKPSSSRASYSGDTRSLPRMNTADSADLFSPRNKSLKSKITRLGRRLRPGSSSSVEDEASASDLPVLTKVTPLASPLEEAEGSDSGSDDEKGGTIKRMPKLRHVSVKRADTTEDDSEAEYHQLFEYVFVVSLKEEAKGKLTTEMTYTFPPTSGEFSGKDEALKSIPQFCFPDIDQWKPTKTYKSESYSFVLTDIEGNRRYGYCRRLLPEGSGPRLPEVFCIVSPLGCFSLYENILDHVEERRAISKLSVFNFLKAISANPFPRPGRSVEVKVFGARGSGMETLTFNRPMDSRLEHVDFSLLFATLSQRKIIQLFSSLLMERRVIFCANSLSLMTGCAHALMALLYPFEWQHVFIPVLPSSLIDFVCSPLPYIIGINPASYKLFDDMEMEEAVIVNLDKGKFLKKIGDETSILPSKLFQFLEGKLSSSTITSEYSKKSPARKGASPLKADDIVVTTFMTFFAYLYGGYEEDIIRNRNGQLEFQRDRFVKRFSSKSTRRFLEAFHMTQLFENFIEQRENPNKAETVSASLFEKRLPELRDRCQDIEIFSSKGRFDRWKMKKDLAKGD